MSRFTTMATADLRPNKYNPNRMTKAEFAELVAEVKRLGRVPKPIVCRKVDGADGYEIVDGEHNHRAAGAAGIETVDVEILKIGDFDAMLETLADSPRAGYAACDRVE